MTKPKAIDKALKYNPWPLQLKCVCLGAAAVERCGSAESSQTCENSASPWRSDLILSTGYLIGCGPVQTAQRESRLDARAKKEQK